MSVPRISMSVPGISTSVPRISHVSSSEAQIAELKAHAGDVNYDDAERREREIRHDVMSHIYAFGLQAPSAKGIIHLGATSAFVTDNTDILQMRDGLAILRRRILTPP